MEAAEVTKIHDGGPAFPKLVAGDSGPSRFDNYRDYNFETIGGMSLRDWFAGQALIGMAWHHPPKTDGALEAELAYKLADAMLAERSKP